ncbi:uncharacterized protein DUF1844 [Edaphobacter aggregans]|uniref:Uncharacterized protein DUF1844 n=1 Tax=Edaphobacter aggregans TaxID=570835 RepID=A0A428MGN2_9BACT|nr:DUF1844 domain-containing protein [Edaphobacter aggregans]RSL16161.1 uncharacterized protein DUF1844 [Edaphobacter aggregans]
MSEKNKPFVITDRRKFTLDGEPRPDADPSPEKESREPAAAAPPPAPTAIPEPPAAPQAEEPEHDLPPAPTAEQTEQSRRAYEMTAERLDTAIRAANPGADHPPAMSFDQLVQSVYLTAMMQLGGATPEGQQPQVDLMGARQSIDMLGVLAEKTKGNLTPDEDRLLESALFELRMAFLEITQALARSAAAKAGSPTGGRPNPVGPSIVR